MAGYLGSPSVAPCAGTELLSVPQRLWYDAQYSDCLTALRTMPPSAARLLLTARTHYRLRHYRDAIELLKDTDAHFVDDTARISRYALAAECSMACGAHHEATTYIAALQEIATSRAETTAHFEVAHALALYAWTAGDLEEADRQIRSIVPTTDEQRVRMTLLRSWIYAKRGQILEQATLLGQALRALWAAPVRDIGSIARSVWALASCTREMFLPKALELVDGIVQELRWTDDIRLDHFQTLRLSGWAFALQGDYIPGIRFLEDSQNFAPTPYFMVLSLFDGAWVSQVANQQLSYAAKAASAYELATNLDWSAVNTEECMGLLVGAELLASIDLGKASTLLEMFERIRCNMTPATLLWRDERVRAMESFVRAIVAWNRTNTNAVRHHATRAYEIFDRLCMPWRTARAALLLYRSGCGDAWLNLAKEHTANYPRSFIAAQIEEASATRNKPGMRGLTARQREVCAELLNGSNIDEIAGLLHISRNTVRNHMRDIYSHFRIHSQAALIKTVRALGERSI